MRKFAPSAWAGLFLAACTSMPPPAAPALVWPGAPEQPRVALVAVVSSAQDLGISKGVMQRLGELLFGSEDLRLIRPMAVAEAGRVLYVADPGVRGVHRFDRTAGRHEILRRADGRPLPSPVGLAVGSAGAIYVSDSSLRKVFVIASGAETAVEVALQAPLRQPTGLAYDAATGRLFVTDTAAHQVLVFDADGHLAATLGRRGEADGEFNFPTLLWRNNKGQLLVTDSLNFRIQVFDEHGKFVSRFGRHGNGTGDMARHKGVATDSYGHIYVVDGLLHAVQIFSSAGKLLMALGAQGAEPGEFWLPAGIFIGADDTIYVADAYNRRVQVFRYIGGPT